MPEIKLIFFIDDFPLSFSLIVNSITGPQLKVVSTMSVGYDHISLPETTKRYQFSYCTYFRDVGCVALLGKILHSYRVLHHK